MTFNSNRNHYLSVSNILVSQERVSCTFKRDVPHAGYLNPILESEVLQEGTSLDLPLWLAEELVAADAVTVDLPKVYKSVYRDILKADARVVDLRKLSKHYFEFGKRASLLNGRQVQDVSESLAQALIERRIGHWEAMDSSGCVKNDSDKKLDSFELEILERSHRSTEAMKYWLANGVPPISVAPLVAQHMRQVALNSSNPF